MCREEMERVSAQGYTKLGLALLDDLFFQKKG